MIVIHETLLITVACLVTEINNLPDTFSRNNKTNFVI